MDNTVRQGVDDEIYVTVMIDGKQHEINIDYDTQARQIFNIMRRDDIENMAYEEIKNYPDIFNMFCDEDYENIAAEIVTDVEDAFMKLEDAHKEKIIKACAFKHLTNFRTIKEVYEKHHCGD